MASRRSRRKMVNKEIILNINYCYNCGEEWDKIDENNYLVCSECGATVKLKEVKQNERTNKR